MRSFFVASFLLMLLGIVIPRLFFWLFNSFPSFFSIHSLWWIGLGIVGIVFWIILFGFCQKRGVSYMGFLLGAGGLLILLIVLTASGVENLFPRGPFDDERRVTVAYVSWYIWTVVFILGGLLFYDRLRSRAEQ